MEKLSEKNSFLAKINEVIFHKGVKGKVVYRIYPSLGRGALQTRTTVAERRIERNNFKIVTFLIIYQSLV